jgi:16S rRNA (adenine1518-N6/adenine1519-N6)-dimethyltransferase
MSLSSISNLRNFLQEKGASPQKKLSQNFLIDGNIVRKIAASAAIEKGDLVIEIGPGPGSLTEELVKLDCRVVAIEKDSLFAHELGRLHEKSSQLTIFEEDILTFPMEKFLKENLPAGKKAKIISNLPYHITTPILTRLFPLHSLISSLTVMVQKEVAHRLVAHAGSSDYGSLSLFTRFYAQADYSFTVSPSCFFPKPQVFSAVVQLHLKKPPLLEGQWTDFFKLTRRAFGHRRKMLRASLKETYGSEHLHASLEECGILPTTRPEELSLEQFLALFHALARKDADQAGKNCDGEDQERDLVGQNHFDLL